MVEVKKLEVRFRIEAEEGREWEPECGGWTSRMLPMF